MRDVRARKEGGAEIGRLVLVADGVCGEAS